MPLSQEIQNFVAQFNNTWNLEVNSACETFFEAQHAAAPPVLNISVEKAVSYGPGARNRLDIYRSDTTQETDKKPIVVYLHGGGFTAGDNEITPHMHANIANYFASNGLIAILATYTLLPQALFPSGAEDVTAALEWITAHIGAYGGDPQNISVLGQSAGSAHLGMALFSGRLQEKGVIPRGIMFMGTPFWYDLSQPRRRTNMIAYYGTEDEYEIQRNSALGLFQRYEGELPRLVISVGERDAGEIVQGNLMFLEQHNKMRKCVPRVEVLKGHNHISYALAMGLEGDETGPMVLDWIRS